jgi:polar amino acid transport system substrate-binding protein
MNFSYQQPKLYRLCVLLALPLFFACAAFGAPAKNAPASAKILRVAVAGTAPFVVKNEKFPQGIAVEIWRDVAAHNGWKYRLIHYPSVPEALLALENQQVDAVVGPTSISSQRARRFEFTQPYFQSSLSILAPVVNLTIRQRITPFFSRAFFVALGILLFLLFVVGTLFWLVERGREDSDFPAAPLPGISSGMWCAVVTMSTVGYGDIAPKTAAGRVIAASWMIISIVAATSLVAGIASTLSLSGSPRRTITTAEELHGHTVAVVADSPAQAFAKRYGAEIQPVKLLEDGYQLLRQNKVEAVVFDRPQLLYFLQQNHDPTVKISSAQYQPQGYGFAFPPDSYLGHQANVRLLQLEESGRVKQIVEMWLGKNEN